jgi:hypothetical protein
MKKQRRIRRQEAMVSMILLAILFYCASPAWILTAEAAFTDTHHLSLTQQRSSSLITSATVENNENQQQVDLDLSAASSFRPDYYAASSSSELRSNNGRSVSSSSLPTRLNGKSQPSSRRLLQQQEQRQHAVDEWSEGMHMLPSSPYGAFQSPDTTSVLQDQEPFYAEKTTTSMLNNNGHRNNGHSLGGKKNGVNGVSASLQMPPSVMVAPTTKTVVEIGPHDADDEDTDTTASSLAQMARSVPGRLLRFVTPWRRRESSTTESLEDEDLKDSEESEGTASTSENSTSISFTALKEKQRQKREERLLAKMSRKRKKQLSSLLQKVNKKTTKNLGGMTARALAGLIGALAEEVEGLGVELYAREETPIWRKQIDSVKIQFTRLGFKPLHMGGPDQLMTSKSDGKKKEKVRKLEKEQVPREQAAKPLSKVVEAPFKQPSAVSSKPSTALSELENGVGGEDQEDYDECPVEYKIDENGDISAVSCIDTAFNQIDVDNSGALDPDEIADALVLAATSMESKQRGLDLQAAAADMGASSRRVIQGLAKQLVALYDTNDDGVIDREEYENMVEDMAALRSVQKEREEKRLLDEQEKEQRNGQWWNWNSWATSILRGNGNATDAELDELLRQQLKSKQGQAVLDMAPESVEMLDVTDLVESAPETLGKIELENLKVDLRRLVFGAIPIVKRVS